MQVSKCVLVCDKTEESSFYRFLLSNLLFPTSAFLDLGFSQTFQELEVGSFSDFPILWSSHKMTWFLGRLVTSVHGMNRPSGPSSLLLFWVCGWDSFPVPYMLHGSDHCFASDACHFQQELSVPDSSVSLSQGDYDSPHFPYFLYQGWGRPWARNKLQLFQLSET